MGSVKMIDQWFSGSVSLQPVLVEEEALSVCLPLCLVVSLIPLPSPATPRAAWKGKLPAAAETRLGFFHLLQLGISARKEQSS